MNKTTPFFDFPDQTIPENKKDEEWHKKHLIDGWHPFYRSGVFGKREAEIEELLNYHACIIYPELEEKIKLMITDRCGEHFGPKYDIFPLIENKIEQISGIYRTRPVKRSAMVMDRKSVTKKLDKKMDLLIEKLVRPANEELKDHLGFAPESPNPEQEIPEDIELFISKNYKTQSEDLAEKILYYILIVRGEHEKIIKALKYYLITETASCYIGEKDGHPTIIVCHPNNFGMDPDPEDDIQKDPNYFVYHEWETYNEICNKYGLSEKEKEELYQYSEENFLSSLDEAERSFYHMDNGIFYYKVTTMIWKSTKSIKIKDFINKRTGKEEFKLLPSDFKDKRNVKKIEFDNLRHVTMIGHEKVLTFGTSEHQMKTRANPRKRIIPAVGLINEKNINKGEIRSVAKKIMFLQDMMSETLYEIKIALGQIDGNVMEYDSSSMPKEFLKNNNIEAGLKKVNFYLKKHRMMITNRKDRRNNSYANSVNMGQNTRIKTLLDFFFVLDGIADKIIGLNDAATGQMAGYEKATVAEMQRYQSTVRIEDTIAPFERFVNEVLMKLVLKAKQIYKAGDILSFFANDNSQMFLEITEDFLEEDIGLHMADLSKEYETKKIVDEVAKQAFSTTNSPDLLLSLMEVLNIDSPTEAEAILRKGVNEINKRSQQREEAVNEIKKEEIAEKKAEREQKSTIEDKRNAKDILVAQIYNDGKLKQEEMKTKNKNVMDLAKIEENLIKSILDKGADAYNQDN